MLKMQTRRLGNVAPFKYGKSLTAERRLSGQYDVYSSAGVCGRSNLYLANKGIIIGRKGSIGTVFYSKTPFYCIDTTFYIDRVAEDCDMKYIFYYLKLLHLEKYNTDAAVPGLNRSLAEKLKLCIPDLPTQQRIADILSTYDDMIENNNRRITLLEQAAQELYKEWFVRFRFPGYENTKFENGLPSQWARVRFGSIIDIIDGDRGTNYPKQEDFLCSGYCVFLNTGNVTKNGFNFSSINYISKEKDLSLRKGKLSRNDVVLTTRGTIGNSAFYNQYVPFENIRINSGMVILRGKPGISQEYIYCLLNSEHWQKSILLYASGSAQPQLPIKDMRRIKIVKPDSSTLVSFTSITKKYYDEIALLSSKNQTLRKQQELLLPRLMNGQWEV